MKEYKLRDQKPRTNEPMPFTEEGEELGREISEALPTTAKQDPALEKEEEPKELTEEFLLKYAEDKLRYKALEGSLEKRKETILGLAGRDLGVAQVGKAIIKKTKQSGQTKVDWEKWLKMLVSQNLLDEEVVQKLAKDKEAVKKKEMEVGYIPRGKDGVNLTIDVVA